LDLGDFFGAFFGGHFGQGLHGWQFGGSGIGQTGSGGGLPSPKKDLISLSIRLMWR
jgi:hypothetical protein